MTAMEKLKSYIEDMRGYQVGNDDVYITVILTHINTWGLEQEKMQIEKAFNDGVESVNKKPNY